MKIESVDFFYLSMPEVLDIGDGSQDALLVRVAAGGLVGYGECEAAPLPSIAAYVCPMSHSACKPVRASVEGQPLEDVADIRRIGDWVRENSLDLLQADHTLSGIDMALWDLLGKRLGEPVYRLLGYPKATPRLPYASQLFGDTPGETFRKAVDAVQQGFRAVKFGWGTFGKSTLEADIHQVEAARLGLGSEAHLMIDAGTVWGEDVERAAQRLPALHAAEVAWLEEPFPGGALAAYEALSQRNPRVPLAGGEGSHNFFTAAQMVDHAGLSFLQIDAGRAGGISIAHRIAVYAQARGVTYVNHTFTSHLALSASLQPYAGMEGALFCEFPIEPKLLAWELTCEHLAPNANGEILPPEAPGLGMTVDTAALRKYLVDVEIKVKGHVIYRTPELK
jgi:L-alanine-DL-glutamate epimerase-like enolase superfamily enzyme